MSELLQNTPHTESQQLADLIHQLFLRLDPRDVEQFYASYHSWALLQRIERLHQRICTFRQQIADNMEQLQQVSPSPIAQAALAQLQAHGVDDIDLLDRMLERGDTWLDHTLQLLEQCERFNFIQGTYTQWCEHALEGAYDWVESIADVNFSTFVPTDDEDLVKVVDTEQLTSSPEVTEEQLLQKLMSEDEAEKHLTIPRSPKITRPLVEETPAITNTQPTPTEAIAIEEEPPAMIEQIAPKEAAQEEISSKEVTKKEEVLEQGQPGWQVVSPPRSESPIVGQTKGIIELREREKSNTIRAAKNKPQRQRNWLWRLLTNIWQTIF